MIRLRNLTIGLLSLSLIASAWAQNGETPDTYVTVPADLGKRILLQKDEVNSGVGVRFVPQKEEYISIAQTFSSSEAKVIDGVGVKLFPNGSNLKGDGRLSYELRFYEVEGEKGSKDRALSIPLKVVPFYMEGEFQESSDYAYIRLPEPLAIEGGRTYAFEIAIMSKNSTRLTIAISKPDATTPATALSGYMLKRANNQPLETIPLAATGYNLAFFLTAAP